MIDFKAVRNAAAISLVRSAQNPLWRNILEFLSKELGQKLAQRRALEELSGPEGPEGDYDETWAELALEMEDMLGLAMVCCQTMFDRTISMCAKANIGGRDGLMKLGVSTDGGLNKAELICALANYYKHESEWDRQVLESKAHTSEKGSTQLERYQLNTARKLVAAGIDIKLPYVLHEGAIKVAGSLENISILVEIFNAWHNEVIRYAQDKLDQTPLRPPASP